METAQEVVGITQPRIAVMKPRLGPVSLIAIARDLIASGIPVVMRVSTAAEKAEAFAIGAHPISSAAKPGAVLHTMNAALRSLAPQAA